MRSPGKLIGRNMMPAIFDHNLLSQLRDAITLGERRAHDDRAVISTGMPALDRVLPRRGFASDAVVELLGGGAQTLAAALARARCRDSGTVVVFDRQREFYPPALIAWGFAPKQLVVIQPGSDADELWAAVQAMRSRAVGAVWLYREQLKPTDFRRLCLACEVGDTLGLLLRPTRARGQPTWADVQLMVQPRPTRNGRRLQIEVTRCRGASPGAVVEVELDDAAGVAMGNSSHETIGLPALSPLVDSAAVRPTARAAYAPVASESAGCTPR
jgi:protein ImuA